VDVFIKNPNIRWTNRGLVAKSNKIPEEFRKLFVKLKEGQMEDYIDRKKQLDSIYNLNYKEFAGCLILGFVCVFVVYSAVINLIF
jgi:hypothetical protein